MQKFVCLLVAFLLAFSLQAQRQLYSHYVFNKSLINPAVVGMKGQANITLGHRNQWQQVEGAPTTSTFFGDFGWKKTGLGTHIVVESLGPYQLINIQADYNYKIFLPEGILSLGFNISAAQHRLNNQNLTAFANGDPAFSNTRTQTEWHPNLGLGAYYATTRFSMGVSIPYAVANIGASPETAPTLQNHTFAHIDVLVPLSPSLLYKPAGILRYVQDQPLNAEINNHLIFKNKYWIGMGYRSDQTFIFSSMIDFNWNKKRPNSFISVGYSYESPSSDIRNAPLGSTHEILVRLNLSRKENLILSPRFLH